MPPPPSDPPHPPDVAAERSFLLSPGDALPSGVEALWRLTGELVAVIGPDHRMHGNAAWMTVLGWSREELLVSGPVELVHPDDLDSAIALRETTATSDAPARVENRWLAKDGTYRTIAWSAYRQDGMWLAVGTDVTERRQVEDAAARSRALLDALREGIAIIDADGRLVEVSDRLCEMTGYAREQLVGCAAPYPYWPSEATAALHELLAEALATRNGTFELTLARSDGTRFPVLVDVADLGGGRVPGMLCVFRDITVEDAERRRLAASEAALSEAHRVARLASWEWFPDSDRLVVSDSVDDFAYSASDRPLTLTEGMAFVPQGQREQVLEGLRSVLDGVDEYVGRFSVDLADGATVWMETRARPFRGPDGRVARVRGTVQDVSEQMRASEQARVRARLLDEVDAAVVAMDLDDRITHWNTGAERLYGWTAAEALGRPVTDFVGGPESAADAAGILRAVRETGAWEGEFEMPRKDGSRFPAYVRDTAIEDGDGHVVGMVSVSVDISERVRAEAELRSARDYLGAVTDSMAEGLVTVDTEGRVTYLNDAAEQMLGWTLAELRGRLLHESTHFRHPDGRAYPLDECPIIRTRVLGERVRVDDDTFIRKDGSELPVAYAASPIELHGGRTGAVIVFHDITERKREQEQIARELEALTWISRIREALETDRLTLHAQPIIDLASQRTISHELLIRMVDEDGGLVPPGAFLPVAEQYGLIRDIDRWVIRQAADIVARGQHVEINISAASLGDGELYGVVERELRRAGANPALVVIEITETALLTNEDAASAFIEQVSALGCRVALDDFGTGYGGFTYLKRLPVDFLKIDIEFVRDLPRNTASQHVVRAIVHLAGDFGQQTIAEGVEDAETLALLGEMGVDFAQGYAIGRPAPFAVPTAAE